MAEVGRPQGVLQRIIHGAAARLAAHADVPEAHREALRTTAVSIFEHEVCRVIGCDTVQISGWSIAPSERANRRERILAAIAAGDAARVIAARELVSERYVRKLRADMADAAGTESP